MRAAFLIAFGVGSLALAAPKAAARAVAPDPIAAATQAMVEADFDKALVILDSALATVKDRVLVPRLQLMRGQALVALQRPDAALKAFSAALEVDPLAVLDPNTASPDAVNLMARARGLISSQLTVTIASGVPAELKLDGTDLGPAPMKTRVGAGKHRIEANGAAGRTVAQDFEVIPGKAMELVLELSPEPVGKPPTPSASSPSERTAPPVGTATATEPAPKRRSNVGVIPIVAGVAAAGVGTAFLFFAQDNHRQLVSVTGPRLDAATEARLASSGALYQTVGFVAIGVGAAAVITGAAMLLFSGGSEGKLQVSALLVPGAGVIGVTGTLDGWR